MGMLDTKTDDYGVGSDTATDDVRERLQKAWISGDINETCGILLHDVEPRCMRWLLSRFQSISEEDAEECFDAAVEGVLRRSTEPEKVNDVYNYVFTSARNGALDLVKEREWFVPLDPELLEGASDDRLLVIAEAALDEEMTVRGYQLKQLFALALPKLAKNRRRLAELLLGEGERLSNEDLARTMGLSKSALKSLKSRTLSDLGRLLPIAAEELGIDFEEVLSPTLDVLKVQHSLPSENNGECGE